MTPETTTMQTEDRLTNLEMKASFAEDLLDKLDQIIIRQQDQIDRLQAEVTWLRQQAPADGATAPRNLRDELPPHY
jgi:SlyX protein